METFGTRSWNYMVYTMLVLEVCTVLYIFIEAVYSATIMMTTALREDYDSCIENVSRFLVRNDVDPVLRQRFEEYLQLCWYTDKVLYLPLKSVCTTTSALTFKFLFVLSVVGNKGSKLPIF